jgi:hypothetical protein
MGIVAPAAVSAAKALKTSLRVEFSTKDRTDMIFLP